VERSKFYGFTPTLKDMLREDNELSNHVYEAKKILCFMSMDYERIHAYPNNCILYRNEYKSLEECPVCEKSW